MKPIISVQELKLLIKQHKDVVLIDARGGADAYNRYLKGHLMGALFVDLETELSKKASDAANGGRHPLPPVNQFTQLLTTLGITPSSIVVVYDDKNGANAAARFWWMMKAVGHEKVFVLDGGYTLAIKSDLSISSEQVKRIPASSTYPVKSWEEKVISMDEAEKAAQNHDQIVIDVREAFRYKGESEPIDMVAGHIPGALNMPYINNLDEQGKFRSPDELRKLYEPIFQSRKPGDVIVHCGSGVTACHTLLAMEQAGYTGAKLYVGSWSEWSRNSKPIAKGDQ